MLKKTSVNVQRGRKCVCCTHIYSGEEQTKLCLYGVKTQRDTFNIMMPQNFKLLSSCWGWVKWSKYQMTIFFLFMSLLWNDYAWFIRYQFHNKIQLLLRPSKWVHKLSSLISYFTLCRPLCFIWHNLGFKIFCETRIIYHFSIRDWHVLKKNLYSRQGIHMQQKALWNCMQIKRLKDQVIWINLKMLNYFVKLNVIRGERGGFHST